MKTIIDRRAFLGSGTLLAGCAATTPRLGSSRADGFVRRESMRLMVGDEPYRFVGANLWYAAYLGADAPYGDRARLRRELDALAAVGVTNLRILASAEEGPLRNSIKPGFRTAGADYNQTLLAGLDFALAEMAKRGMRAVLYLTNFWEWSGGMMTYLSYVNGGRYLDMNDPAHPWPAFANFNSQFYGNAQAVALYRDWIRTVVTRTNGMTGRPYAQDPTIMAWQLANEPRPSGDEAHAKLPEFYAWVEGSAGFIKSLDPNHLVSTGSEGLKGALERADIVLAEHAPAAIDYLTVHIWPNNWGWVQQKDLASTAARGEALTDEYIAQHVTLARQLNKPMVIEEFGYPRDGGSNDPAVATTYKDRFYRRIHAATLASMQAGGPIAGTNFWAWNGEARAAHPDYKFREGDRQYMGDPPHEPQGWYGIFTGDSTVRLVADHARAIARLPR
ncbi:glycoside hydrolase 5 family protein [Sphingomonas xinjiangensis]|uniref:mannan endo-1,4-beta-mannosidase n=1 Tax=Sphingomonas xinjiangensis TaxID=643568 RepID=A0A840YSM4_9SPHN|nr:cellulase family glycosylhydrolase [Sphingomonas xinjiangensis]MBB5712670.1 mannan endo-1,4-beta-mannosidase [Sphingomonas xinjiangensis]